MFWSGSGRACQHIGVEEPWSQWRDGEGVCSFIRSSSPVARKAPTARGLTTSEETPEEPVPPAGCSATLFSRVKHDCLGRGRDGQRDLD